VVATAELAIVAGCGAADGPRLDVVALAALRRQSAAGMRAVPVAHLERPSHRSGESASSTEIDHPGRPVEHHPLDQRLAQH